MAMFDIIDSAGYGYRLAWQEKRYLARLATLPTLIKWISIFFILKADWQGFNLKPNLLLLPSFFADGWMYSHYARLIFFDQRWPFKPSGDAAADRQDLMDRAHFLMAGTLTFVLFHFLMGGFFVCELFVFTHAAQMAQAPTPQMPTSLALMVLVSLVFGLWFIRFLWFYIPASLGYSLHDCRRDVRGMMTSVLMVLTMLICYVPLWVVQHLVESVASGYDVAHPETWPVTVLVFISMVESVSDSAIGLIVTGAMAYAFYEMISLKRGPASGRPPRP